MDQQYSKIASAVHMSFPLRSYSHHRSSPYPVLQDNYLQLPSAATLEGTSEVGNLPGQWVDQRKNVPQSSFSQGQSFRDKTRVRQLQLGNHRTQTRKVGFTLRRGPAELIGKPLLLCTICQFPEDQNTTNCVINLPKRLFTYLTGATPVTGSPIVLKYSAVSPVLSTSCLTP
jgi:hypothetical protein